MFVLEHKTNYPLNAVAMGSKSSHEIIMPFYIGILRAHVGSSHRCCLFVGAAAAFIVNIGRHSHTHTHTILMPVYAMRCSLAKMMMKSNSTKPESKIDIGQNVTHYDSLNGLTRTHTLVHTVNSSNARIATRIRIRIRFHT